MTPEFYSDQYKGIRVLQELSRRSVEADRERPNGDDYNWTETLMKNIHCPGPGDCPCTTIPLPGRGGTRVSHVFREDEYFSAMAASLKMEEISTSIPPSWINTICEESGIGRR